MRSFSFDENLPTGSVIDQVKFFEHNPAIDQKSYGIEEGVGELVWKRQLGGGVSSSSPSISHDGKLVFMGHGSGVMAVDILTGHERWRFNAGQKVYSVTVGTNGLLYCGYQKIFALEQTTGEKVWEFDAVDQTFDMALSNDGYLYVISGAGYLHALNAENGEEVWRDNSLGVLVGVTSQAPAIDSEGNLYAAGRDKLRKYNGETGEQIWETTDVHFSRQPILDEVTGQNSWLRRR